MAKKRNKKKVVENSNANDTAFGAIVGVSFIFAIDLIGPKITGNAIATGNTPVDLSAGLILLVACLAGTYFLFKKPLKPMPHPEKKSRKTKTKKSRKK